MTLRHPELHLWVPVAAVPSSCSPNHGPEPKEHQKKFTKSVLDTCEWTVTRPTTSHSSGLWSQYIDWIQLGRASLYRCVWQDYRRLGSFAPPTKLFWPRVKASMQWPIKNPKNCKQNNTTVSVWPHDMLHHMRCACFVSTTILTVVCIIYM